ncbi:MAG: hypothetical protein U0O21_01100 [Lachnospiraceae bacterium]
MMYFKVTDSLGSISVGTTRDLRYYQKKHKILLLADETQAQYIQIGDKLYRDYWFAPVITYQVSFEMANISVISKEEYDEQIKN